MKESEPVTVSMVAHAGEVLVIFPKELTSLTLAPQCARDLARWLIERAEIAEQQMDAENG